LFFLTFSLCFKPLTMASFAGLQLKKPIIPIISEVDYDNLNMVKMIHQFDQGGTPTTRKASLPSCSDPANKELLLYVVDQFHKARAHNILWLDDAEHYDFFPMVLGGNALIAWETISNARAIADRTDANFLVDVQTFLTEFVSTSSRLDQAEYMRNFKKTPTNITVENLSNRLMFINRLSRWFPGDGYQNATTLFPTENDRKRAFFLMMPDTWRLSLLETGVDIDEQNYTLRNLVLTMSNKAAASDAKMTMGKRKSSSGRGRGGGRGNRGRGRGRGNRGNYTYYQGSNYHNNNNYNVPKQERRGGYQPQGRGGGFRGGRGGFGRGGFGRGGRAPQGRGGFGQGRGYSNQNYHSEHTPSHQPSRAAAARGTQSYDNYYGEQQGTVQYESYNDSDYQYNQYSGQEPSYDDYETTDVTTDHYHYEDHDVSYDDYPQEFPSEY